jgi:hypothetical protein
MEPVYGGVVFVGGLFWDEGGFSDFLRFRGIASLEVYHLFFWD